MEFFPPITNASRIKKVPVRGTISGRRKESTVLNNSHQRHFQKILWKKGLNETVQIFKLKTLIYGTTPACYLSTRVLKQLPLDERENFPKAADVVLHDIYLDDILSGCSSLNERESLKTEITQLFKSSGVSLHKWCFSHSTQMISLIYTSINHRRSI
ncbi:uncharacterized protein TNCV_3108171 [Trichonephila clavipes]|uniref:Uncharacterized protein n=1 Tax=Trichonephila clavipes TaxID=2585209 RepID=A0A8X6SFQ9_TRICX|nr:uncharacterized protein TNCV_3108171 [Trichonephila clavipes]